MLFSYLLRIIKHYRRATIETDNARGQCARNAGGKGKQNSDKKYIGPFTKVISIIAITWSLFSIYVNSFGVLDAIRLRSWHIIFTSYDLFIISRLQKGKKEKVITNGV